MSDVEEPPTKVIKYEMSQTYTQPEEMEDTQEEWLSEEMLTDDDATVGEDRSDSAVNDNSQFTTDISKDNTAMTLEASSKVDDSNIEQELNNMDNEQVC